MWKFWLPLTFVTSTVRTRKNPWVKKTFEYLDEIGMKRQAYPENVFVNNHCKVILLKYKTQVKLC